jgi:post-segregation antitoxin (ccd killing protein)
MQVYLPDDLYQAVKDRALPASELLQEAVRRELHRRTLLDLADAYVVDLINEVGEPTAKEWARAEALVARLQRSATPSAR